MLQVNSDISFLRHLIDLIEAERMRNVFRDRRLEEYVSRYEQLEDRLASLESIVPDLRYRVDRQAELEYMENPYSLDGHARCNA
jgi:predicted  nucleic acid-binding Zn-ribbon protein